MSAAATSPATPTASADRSRGVYILGNDVVLEFAIGLFRSLRHYSPDIPVRLLPYDGRLTKLRPWMKLYNVELHEDPDYGFYDRLGDELWGEVHMGHHMFRKFAAFSGPFDDFLYLDIDIAILAPVEKLFNEFTRSGAQFMTFDSDIDNVYKRTEWTAALAKAGRTKGFNAGAFLAQRGHFSHEELVTLIADAKRLRENFVYQYDQPFFNFVVDMKGLHQVRLPEFNAAYPDKIWGDIKPVVQQRDGTWLLLAPGHADYGKAHAILHWAGHHGDDPFPNRHVFYHFRLMGESTSAALAYKLADRWRWIGPRAFKKFRRNCKDASDRFRCSFGRWRQSIFSRA